MREDLQAWMRAGVDVRVCVSSGEGPINGIPFTYGRIQDVLRAGASARQGLDYRIFAVGAPSLFEGLRTRASELGVTSEHIHQNI